MGASGIGMRIASIGAGVCRIKFRLPGNERMRTGGPKIEALRSFTKYLLKIHGTCMPDISLGS